MILIASKLRRAVRIMIASTGISAAASVSALHDQGLQLLAGARRQTTTVNT